MSELDFGPTIRGFVVGQKLFNRYELKRILGRGGMGVVWLAYDAKLDTDVALKFLPEIVVLDPKAMDELKREAKRNLQVTHAHIVRIYDFVDDPSSAAIAMEFVDGQTLSKLGLERPGGVFSPEELQPWVGQFCEAMAYAHEKAKIVHRDLKPTNLMIAQDGDLKITDFGIARSIADSVTRVSASAGTSGSPPYMSPQQLNGLAPKVTDDVYAFGATLYELLTGKPPFHSGGGAAIFHQILNVVPPPVAERRAEFEIAGAPIPAAWEATIAACLAKEAAARPQSMREIALRLAGGKAPSVLLSTRPEAGKIESKKSKAPLYAALAVGLIALASLGYYFGVYVPENERRMAEQTRLAAEQRNQAAMRVAEQKRVEEEKREAQSKQQEIEAAKKQRQLGIMGKIDRLADDAPRRDLETMAEEVRLYLSTIEEPFRPEVQNRWMAKREAWNTRYEENQPGEILVQSVPTGAMVTSGELVPLKTPAHFSGLKPGKAVFAFSLPGYEPQNQEVTVVAGKLTTLPIVNLVRSAGSLRVESTPPGLDYRLEGDGVVTTGKTPAGHELPTGNYVIKLQREGWRPITREVSVNRNQRSQVSIMATGATLVFKNEGRAEIGLNGRKLTPEESTLRELEPGKYTITAEAKWYLPLRQEIELATGEIQEHRIELIPSEERKLLLVVAGKRWAHMAVFPPVRSEIRIDQNGLVTCLVKDAVFGGGEFKETILAIDPQTKMLTFGTPDGLGPNGHRLFLQADGRLKWIAGWGTTTVLSPQ